MHFPQLHTQRGRDREREIKLPQLLKMLTIAWVSALSDVHQQLQAPVRITEEHFLSPQHVTGTQQHSGAPERKRSSI
jgi:hypothetical protein